jgi:hypothetical protein
MFITDAILHGMPPHIAQLVAGHRDINTTMGYKAVYPEEMIMAHRAFISRRRALRPSDVELFHLLLHAGLSRRSYDPLRPRQLWLPSVTDL